MEGEMSVEVEAGEGRGLSREGVGVRTDRGIGQGVGVTRVSHIKTRITENITRETADPTPDTHLTENPSSHSNSTSPGASSNVSQSHAVKTSGIYKRISI